MSDIEKNIEATEAPLIEVKDLKQYFNLIHAVNDIINHHGKNKYLSNIDRGTPRNG